MIWTPLYFNSLKSFNEWSRAGALPLFIHSSKNVTFNLFPLLFNKKNPSSFWMIITKSLPNVMLVRDLNSWLLYHSSLFLLQITKQPYHSYSEWLLVITPQGDQCKNQQVSTTHFELTFGSCLIFSCDFQLQWLGLKIYLPWKNSIVTLGSNLFLLISNWKSYM